MSRIKAGFATGIAIGVTLAGAVIGVASSSAHQARTASVTPSNLSPKDFNPSMSAMKYLKGLAAQGSGGVYLILPDTTTSARYTQFDTPLFLKAMKLAGLKSSQYGVQNGQKSDSTFITLAQADVAKGAKVLLIDPEDAGTGKTVAKYAAKHGVKVIDYDRLTVGPYYDSFDNVFVGHLLGTGLTSCVSAWKAHNPALAHPKVIVMRGDPTDNNATLFYNGYHAVLQPKFSSGAWADEANPPGTWTPATALTEFTQAFTAHPSANALLSPNDENASPIITYLQTQRVKPYTFPVTGQDATTVGLQDMIAGYQCGTVYKPVFLEAEAGAALALYVRAGVKPPKSLLNGRTANPNAGGAKVPSVIVTPEWVTPQTIEMTIVHDHSVPAGTICTGQAPSGQPTYRADCKKYGIH
jgi:D-xylose transport system substrate-binding protein